MSGSGCWLVRNTSTFSSSCPLSLDRSGIPTLPFLYVPYHCFQLFIVPFCHLFANHSAFSRCPQESRLVGYVHCPNQLFCLFRIVSNSNLSSCSSCIYLLVKFHQFSFGFFSKILDHSHWYVIYTFRFSCFILFIAYNSISSLSRLRPSSHKKNVDDSPHPLTLV